MITFDAPFVLYAAPLAALLVAMLAWWARRVRVRHAARWSSDLAAMARRGRFGWVGLGGAVLAATLALSGPRWGHRVVTAESKALNLVIALDISRSMLAEDVAPSRLRRAQREARRLIQDLSSDRIGLVAFAGQSFIMSPLTVDGSALQLLVDGLDPDMVSAGGTGLSRALKQGTELLLGEADVADRVLVVFTDGEPTSDSLPDIVAQAERLERAGVRLILVAEGGREPAAIPLRGPDGQLLGQQRDADGVPVRTSRRDPELSAIADAAKGAVVSADLRDQAGAVRELVLAYKRAPQATALTSSGVPRAWIPLFAGVLLLLVHSVTRRTAALAAIMLALAWPREAGAQGVPRRGDEYWRRGDFRGAAVRYIADVKAGAGGDTAWLAAGTAGLALNDTALARAALSRAAESIDPEVRFRAVYNLGLLHLRQAARDSAGPDRELAEARRRYREALLLRPGDAASKWNLELTVKRSPPSGGGGSDSPTPNASAAPANAPPRPQSLTAAQADQILNSIAEDERKTRQELNRRMAQNRQATGERDW